MVTTQAAITPVVAVPSPTPAISSSVVQAEPGSTVDRRCGQVLPEDPAAITRSAAKGIARTARTANATVSAPPLPVRMRRRNRDAWPDPGRTLISGPRAMQAPGGACGRRHCDAAQELGPAS